MAALVLAFVFAAATACVAVPEKRRLGAKIGFIAGLNALVPILFLAIVFFAFDSSFSDSGTGTLWLIAIPLTALVVVAFRVARASQEPGRNNS